jgi:hypothetical protein
MVIDNNNDNDKFFVLRHYKSKGRREKITIHTITIDEYIGHLK